MNLEIKGLEPRMNINTKKEVIESVLKKHLDSETLQKMMNHWVKKYSREPVFVLHRFLSDVASVTDVSISVSDLKTEILFGLEHKKQALALSSQLKSLSAKELCFYEFISHLNNQIVDNKDKIVKQFVNDSNFLEYSEQLMLEEFLLGSSQEQTGLSSDNLSQIISQFYGTLCLWLGPLKADELLANTINHMSSTPYADHVAELI